jgi:hypothetical protein
MGQRNQRVWQNTIKKTRGFLESKTHHPIFIGTGVFLVGSFLTIGLASDSHLPTASPPEMVFDEEIKEDPTTLFVKGKILDIVDELIVLVEGIDGTVELQITEETVFQSTLHIGDHIVASVSPQGNVRKVTVVESKDIF